MPYSIPRGERIIAFGDIHLHWAAAQAILGLAEKKGINCAVNLGDEAIISPTDSERGELTYVYDQLRRFKSGNVRRVLVCVAGDKTGYVPEDLIDTYYHPEPNKPSHSQPFIFHQDNIICVHRGGYILEKYKYILKSYTGYEPLVIFHGHSHSMGVLPEYKWLENNEFVHFMDKTTKYHLQPRKIYWVNPGAVFAVAENGRMAANCAIYDPVNQEIILQSIHKFC